MRANEFGTNPKRPQRPGSRPARGHESQPRYKTASPDVGESSDLELDQHKKFAQTHYSSLSPELAFQKWVQRSLLHSREEDEMQDERIDKIEKQLRQLSANGVHEVVLNPSRTIDSQGHSAANPYGKTNATGNTIINRDNVDMDKVTARAKAMFQQGMTEQQVKDALVKQGVAPRLADQAVQAGQMNESKPCWKGYKQIGMKDKGGKKVPNCVPTEGIEEDWNSVNKHDKTDGLSQKAVNAYRNEHPGSKLKTAVTKKPSEIKNGSSDDKRRKSFCSRMSGMKKHNASAETKRDPDSPINKALRRWHCESMEAIGEWLIQERGKASRSLCTSSKPDEELGASQLASCKSQGLRARDGEKSHLIGHGGAKVRIKVGGKRIKGKKYGGPLPDYGTRKDQQ